MLPIELINWLVMSFLQHTFREKEDIFPHPLSLSFSYCFFVITDCSVVRSSFVHIHTQSNRYAKHFYKAIIFFAKESKCVTRGTNVYFFLPHLFPHFLLPFLLHFLLCSGRWCGYTFSYKWASVCFPFLLIKCLLHWESFERQVNLYIISSWAAFFYNINDFLLYKDPQRKDLLYFFAESGTKNGGDSQSVTHSFSFLLGALINLNFFLV